ncbi:hypothetical protein [Microlunatus flavus]|uniref:Lipoprotein n=1 Tax=Microlunatus flavus TaxID=1036181 RepID=A0A1H9C4Z2_9ACTN|nr:hypothetical protein [Microlunatus flavus]SEP96266.1 hypothetical protein SAMN05421756_10276 [Microlunatus flavus]
MDRRISRALAAGVVVSLPLLAGCGGGADSGSGAPAGTSAPATSQAAAPSTSAAAPSTPASTTEPSPSSSPSTDTAADKKDVQKASEKFVTAVLTIGYPDKSYTKDYLPRLEPLMTKSGYASVKTTETEKEGTKALKQLYSQRSRSSPDLKGDTKVSDLTADSATAKISYENRAQLKQGGDWKTIKKLGKDSVTIKLVKDGGKWLVDDAK